MEYCSQLHSWCYVTQQVISDGRNSTLLQKYAGCVDPAQNVLLMASMNTHFCNNFDSAAMDVPCMKIDQDFSLRRSCYVCQDCDNVFLLDHRAKHLCPEGTSGCYSVMTRDHTVRRGCDHHSDRFIQKCGLRKELCARCDYDYCNFHRVGAAPGLCYKTRPHMHKSHLMTMRLEECTGRGLMQVWPDCYVALKTSLFIEAGCVNEAQDKDIVTWVRIEKGDLAIVHRKKLSCYKCTGNQTDFCYNVRHLKPEECRGQHQYAIRGCYTMLLKNSIQRGCLTELDLYHQRMCSDVHFAEICITCIRDYCNIHRP